MEEIVVIELKNHLPFVQCKYYHEEYVEIIIKCILYQNIKASINRKLIKTKSKRALKFL